MYIHAYLLLLDHLGDLRLVSKQLRSTGPAFLAAEHRRTLDSTELYSLMTQCVCKQLA